jgi:hypothetical protein
LYLAGKGCVPTHNTYLASVLAEEMLKAGQQIVALDPTGSFWGLQASADGKQPGFPILVLGGEHGNLPLEEQAGEVIASAIVEGRLSAVLDLSLFRKGQMIRFMVAFIETLYRLNREAMHLFVDEADFFAPQGRSGYGVDENRMLGAMEDLVRRGRRRGIGCTLITQRPAVLHKSVLTQSESLFVLRMVHPRDIDAIKEWVNVHAEPSEAQTVIGSLPTLPVGHTWFWSPGWLGKLDRVIVRQRETFDSSATPKPGEQLRVPKRLAEVDLAALGDRIREAAQRAKENDPRELKRQVAELQKKLRETPQPEVRLQEVQVPCFTGDQTELTQQTIREMSQLRETAAALLAGLEPLIRGLSTAMSHTVETMKTPWQNRQRPAATSQPERPARPAPTGEAAGTAIPRGERSILAVLIQYPGGLRREQLTVLTGYKRSSRDAYLQRLREKGYVDTNGERVTVTAEGEAALPDAAPLPTGRAL